MKRLVIITILAFIGFNNFAQLVMGVNTQMEASLDYKVKRFRFGASFDPDKNDLNMVMPTLKYEFIQNDDYQLYAGLVLIDFNPVTSVRLPIGLNYFPFEKKQFGFSMEIYGSYGKEYEWTEPEGYDNRFFIRGSLGLVFVFN